jgi:hypothetical protein
MSWSFATSSARAGIARKRREKKIGSRFMAKPPEKMTRWSLARGALVVEILLSSFQEIGNGADPDV